ncbi:hypothetical protein CDD83_7334 [Cordyceps sp. RAO-2017]|nr:hypothetical protein CDD83_7334 [Cordyceps sp. RAO-2017]
MGVDMFHDDGGEGTGKAWASCSPPRPGRYDGCRVRGQLFSSSADRTLTGYLTVPRASAIRKQGCSRASEAREAQGGHVVVPRQDGGKPQAPQARSSPFVSSSASTASASCLVRDRRRSRWTAQLEESEEEKEEREKTGREPSGERRVDVWSGYGLFPQWPSSTPSLALPRPAADNGQWTRRD